MKLDWQWPAALVFSVVCATIGFLVYMGKLHPEAMLIVMTWLAPAPYQARPQPPTMPPPGAH